MHEAPVIFPLNIVIAMGIPPYVAFSWVATAIILIVAIMVRSSIKMVPSGVQNLAEVILEFFINLADTTIGHMGRTFVPLMATLGIYILVCNFLGLIPGCEAPTSNLNTTVALALPVFLTTHYYGIKEHKLGYIKHFVGPIRSLPALPLDDPYVCYRAYRPPRKALNIVCQVVR